ncbi:MAG: EthD family reductase [Micromonosporaceae bacterium]
MVRFLVLYSTPQDPEAFDRHYRDVHIPLAKKLPGLRRYTISRNSSAVRGGEPYHLVAELDWDDMASAERAFQSPEGQAAGQDVPDFATGGVQSMLFELEEV